MSGKPHAGRTRVTTLGLLVGMTGLIGIASGCSTTVALRPGAADYGSVVSSINDKGALKPGILVIGADTVRDARSIRIVGDSVRWVFAGAVHTADLATVREITFIDRGKGGSRGVQVALGLTVAIAGAAVLAARNDTSDGLPVFRVVLATIGPAAIGVPIGLFVGMAEGFKEIFVVR